MNERDFIYWLKGFLELSRSSETAEPLTLDSSQVASIEKHLNLVLEKPNYVSVGVGGYMNLTQAQGTAGSGSLVDPIGGKVTITC